MFRIFVTLLLLLLSVSLSACRYSAVRGEISVSQETQSRCAIVIGDGAHSTEVHAANELARYFKIITGATVPIYTLSTPDGNDLHPETSLVIGIGNGATNPHVVHLVESGKVQFPEASKGWGALDV